MFYVYIHRKKTDGTIFYVGKGHGNRAWRKVDRSSWWWKTVKKHGFTYEIVRDGLSEIEALNLEIELISKYGRRDQGKGTLVNLTDGGQGVSNPPKYVRDAQRNAQSNKDVHKFFHEEHGEFIGTRDELVKKFSLSSTDRRNLSDMVRIGRYRHVKGWEVDGNKFTPRDVYRPGPKDIEAYTLYNESKSMVYCGGRHCFCDEVSIPSSRFSMLKSGKVKSSAGWTLNG